MEIMLKKLVLYIWQLPQHLFAVIILFLFKGIQDSEYKDKKVFKVYGKFIFGVSLGNYIILHNVYFTQSNWRLTQTIKHEYGHSIQSLYFGPLYLIVIGIPSATFNVISRISPTFAKNYYNRWPENWANKLGESDL